jgi:hypothetical protein
MNALAKQTQKEQQVIQSIFTEQKFNEIMAIPMNCKQNYELVTDIYAQARKYLKLITEKEKKLLEPYKEKINEIRYEAKTHKEPLQRMIDICNAKADDWQKYINMKSLEKQRKLIEAAKLFGTEMPIMVDDITKPKSTKNTTSTTKTVMKFRITDLSKVPIKYLKIDEEAVNLDIKLGIHNIDGLEIYSETKTTLRKI